MTNRLNTKHIQNLEKFKQYVAFTDEEKQKEDSVFLKILKSNINSLNNYGYKDPYMELVANCENLKVSNQNKLSVVLEKPVFELDNTILAFLKPSLG